MFSQPNYFEGNWNIVHYPQHPECVGSQLKISRDAQNPYLYRLHSRVVNILNSTIEYSPFTNKWTPSAVASTLMMGPSELMAKERLVSDLMSNIRKIKFHGGQFLIIKTNNGEQVQLAPALVTS